MNSEQKPRTSGRGAVTRSVLNARHEVADAHNDVTRVAGCIARALAWQSGDEISVVSDLESALPLLSAAQRKLHEAIVGLRKAATENEVQP